MRRRAATIAILVFAFSVVWIVLTDQVAALFPPPTAHILQSVKGIFYVSVVSIFVYFLVLRALHNDIVLIEHQARLMEVETLKTSSLLTLGLSHDIRNYAGAIEMNAHYLQNRLSPELKEAREAASDIYALSFRLRSLADRLSLQRQKEDHDFDPAAALEEFVTLLNRSSLLHSPVTLEVRGETKPIRGNIVRFEQAIGNIVLNGDQASAEGEPIEVLYEGEADRARISITDHGPGIPADVLDRIWEPLFSTKEKGSGLGMFTVREGIRSFGGTVKVDSAEGNGTTFVLELPLRQSEASHH